MRALIPALLVLGASALPAAAQTYDPAFPVCLQVFGRFSFVECRYTSIPQCQVSASGRSAQCLVNPFFIPPERPVRRRARR